MALGVSLSVTSRILLGLGLSLAGSGPSIDNAAVVAGAQPGTLVGNIRNVPAGATPAITPNDGRLQILGDEVNGWRLFVGASAIAPGAINANIVAGASIGAIKVTVSAAVAQPARGEYFASTRLRSPNTLGLVAAGSEYACFVTEFYAPAYSSNSFRAYFAGHYSNSNVTPVIAGADAPNAVTIEGATLWAFIGSAWVQGPALTFNGSPSAIVLPGVGLRSDPVVFPVSVPANARMEIRVATKVNPGESLPGNTIVSMATAMTAPFRTVASVEGAGGGAASQVAQLSVSTKPTGTDARVGGSATYSPSFITSVPDAPLDRPVFLHFGDSKTWGKNENDSYNINKYLSEGFVARTFDDDTSSRRMAVYILSVPSMGFPSLLPTAPWGVAGSKPSNLWGLLRLCDNRPWTHMADDHYNNGGLTAGDLTYPARFNAYFGMILRESSFWGNAPAPLYKFRPIGRAGSWATTLAGQAPGADALGQPGTRWALDADLVAGSFPGLTGAIPTNTYYAYDQAANRDKVKLGANSYTTAAAYVSGATQISLTTPPQPDEMLVLNPASAAGGAYVRSVSGSGPYVVTLRTGVAISTIAAGAVIPTTNVSDTAGLHPCAAGHQLIAQAAIGWKQATFG